MYRQIQNNKNYNTDQLRDSAKFFQVVVSGLILGSFALGFETGPVSVRAVTPVFSLLGVVFSITGLLDVRRCYVNFLKYTEISWNIEELLGLHREINHKSVKTILPMSSESKQDICNLMDSLNKKSFVITALRSNTLIRTFTWVFLFLIVLSSTSFLLGLWNFMVV